MSRKLTIEVSNTQLNILRAIADLILMREGEDNINKNININANAVSKISGHDYKTCKTNLKKLKDL